MTKASKRLVMLNRVEFNRNSELIEKSSNQEKFITDQKKNINGFII